MKKLHEIKAETPVRVTDLSYKVCAYPNATVRLFYYPNNRRRVPLHETYLGSGNSAEECHLHALNIDMKKGERLMLWSYGVGRNSSVVGKISAFYDELECK